MSQDSPENPEHSPTVLAGGGETGSLLRAVDWQTNPLGNPETWPQSLKTAVRIILTSNRPMFVWWGPDLINIYNDSYSDILGPRHPAALAQPAQGVWREIWDQIQPRVDSALLRNQGTFDEELLLLMERHGYREETYFTFSYSPIPDEQGRPAGIFCATGDETSRILSRRRLVTQQELAARTADASSVAEACRQCAAALATNPYDLPFAYLYTRNAGEERFLPADGSPLDPAATNWWRLGEVFAAGRAVVVDLPAQVAFPMGAWETPPVRAIVMPINASELGQPAVLVAGLNPNLPYDRAYAQFMEMAAQQIGLALNSARAYQEERRRAETLAELDRAKTAFFSNISHEFRTPLTLMLGPLEDLLGKGERTSGDDRDTLAVIHRNAVRLQKLVNALLDFSRIEAGRMIAHRRAVDLSAFTAELASTFRSAMERAGLDFKVECRPLPRPVAVDPALWEKIVLNLLSNALKYTFEGTVSLRLAEVGGQVQLTVSDTGTGIPAAELPRLFERFHRVEGARGRTFEGTGIGLALVDELVRLHEGSVGVVSELNRGSTFTVTMPFGSAAQNADLTVIQALHPEQQNPFLEEALDWLPRAIEPPVEKVDRGSRERVLLADDNADMRDYLRRLLATEYEVAVSPNGHQALQMALVNPPDLVLSDIMMPELDGFGLLQALRSHAATKAVPVVFLSARAGEEASAEGREAGADDYIVKPFTAREVLARVRGTLQIHRERQRASRQLEEVFAQAPVAIVVLRGHDLVIELANPSYQAIVGKGNLVGRRLREVIPDAGGEFWDALQRVFDSGEPFVANEWAIPFDSDGDGIAEQHWFNIAQHPWRDAHGAVAGVIAVLTDVTPQMEARREVERINRELEEFAYVASHDLQEPLRAVNAYTQLLVRRLNGLSPEQLQQYANYIGAGVRRMEQLIRDLLSFARTVQSEAPVLHPVSLDGSWAKAAEMLRTQIQEKNARIDVGYLPIVLGEETQLPQLFQNLLSNALKYARDEVSPHIQVSARRSGDRWTVSLRDNGIGFSQEYAEHVFGLFKRLHRDEYSGTGLGLAICKRIVERFGGRIWAESVPGEGSTFSFTLLATGND